MRDYNLVLNDFSVEFMKQGIPPHLTHSLAEALKGKDYTYLLPYFCSWVLAVMENKGLKSSCISIATAMRHALNRHLQLGCTEPHSRELWEKYYERLDSYKSKEGVLFTYICVAVLDPKPNTTSHIIRAAKVCKIPVARQAEKLLELIKTGR